MTPTAGDFLDAWVADPTIIVPRTRGSIYSREPNIMHISGSRAIAVNSRYNGERIIIINGDAIGPGGFYGHYYYQNCLRGAAADHHPTPIPDLTVPFSTLPTRPDAMTLVDYTGDDHAWLEEEDDTEANRRALEREGYRVFAAYTATGVRYRAHRPGGSLWLYGGYTYLASADFHNQIAQFFCTKLYNGPKTVAEAFVALQPRVVQDAYRDGAQVKRQGEWFFIPRPDLATSDVPKSTRLRKFALDDEPLLTPADARVDNKHIATEVGFIMDPQVLRTERYPCRDDGSFGGGRVYARGTIRHTGGQHPYLSLGRVWHQVARNTSLESRSIMGRFD